VKPNIGLVQQPSSALNYQPMDIEDPQALKEGDETLKNLVESSIQAVTADAERATPSHQMNSIETMNEP